MNKITFEFIATPDLITCNKNGELLLQCRTSDFVISDILSRSLADSIFLSMVSAAHEQALTIGEFKA